MGAVLAAAGPNWLYSTRVLLLVLVHVLPVCIYKHAEAGG